MKIAFCFLTCKNLNNLNLWKQFFVNNKDYNIYIHNKEEINDEYLEIITPKEERRFNPMIDANIFGDVKPNQIRFNKKNYTATKPLNNKPRVPKNLKKISNNSYAVNLFDSKLTVGNIVNHQRFGNGEVLKIEGKGADLKAEIKFSSVGIKKLLLRFAKLEILS